MNEEKDYTLKAETGKYTLKGEKVQFILKKVHNYIVFSRNWIIALIFIFFLQFLFTLYRGEKLIYILINVSFLLLSGYVGYKAISCVKEIKKTIK